MNTATVSLIKRPRTLPSGKRAHYWYLRWADTQGKHRYESIGRTDTLTRAQAKELRRRKETGLTVGDVPRDASSRMTLGEFRDFYKSQRRRGDAPHTRRFLKKYPKLGEQTITKHDMVLRYLIQHFGKARRIDSIDELAAEQWLDALAAGKLAATRAEGWGDRALSEQTLRGVVRDAKTILNWAKTFRLIHANPFADFTGQPLPAADNYYLPLADFDTLLRAAWSQPWRALFGLCRLGGLRRGEALAVPWAGRATDRDGLEQSIGIDLDVHRLRVVAVKTRIYREVPIRPALHEILQATRRTGGVGRVVQPITVNNLTRNAQAMIRDAGLTPWPKTYQAMRSSCENDWKLAGCAEATYAKWMGHDPSVSRKHYVSPTAAEFDAVTAA